MYVQYYIQCTLNLFGIRVEHGGLISGILFVHTSSSFCDRSCCLGARRGHLVLFDMAWNLDLPEFPMYICTRLWNDHVTVILQLGCRCEYLNKPLSVTLSTETGECARVYYSKMLSGTSLYIFYSNSVESLVSTTPQVLPRIVGWRWAINLTYMEEVRRDVYSVQESPRHSGGPVAVGLLAR